LGELGSEVLEGKREGVEAESWGGEGGVGGRHAAWRWGGGWEGKGGREGGEIEVGVGGRKGR